VAKTPAADAVTTSAPKIVSRSFAAIKPGSESWVWPGFVPRGRVVILEGRKGCGKSTVAACIAAHMTGSSKRLPGVKGTKPTNVCWLTKEESYSTAVVPRLKSAGAKLERCSHPESEQHAGQPRSLVLPTDYGVLQDYVKQESIGLIVLDPVFSFIDSTISLKDEQQTRSALEPMCQLAEKNGCTVLFIRHVRKSTSGAALDHGLGGVGIGNLARVVLRVFVDTEDDEKHYLSVVASNIAAIPSTRTFRITERPKSGLHVEWEGTTEKGADELAADSTDSSERSALEDAKAFLKVELDAEAQTVERLKSLCEKMGISPRTLRRAKVDLHVGSRQRKTDNGREWVWERPDEWSEE